MLHVSVAGVLKYIGYIRKEEQVRKIKSGILERRNK